MNDQSKETRYISPYKVKDKYDVSSNTLRTWADNGTIRFIRIRDGKGKRLYNLEDIDRIFCSTTTDRIDVPEKVICYARVSSDHQKEDLNRQIELLRKNFPKAEIISDIGSGLNFKRKGFETLLERISKGDVSTIVVTYKDRLCRFGFELFEWFIKKFKTRLVVLNSLTDQEEKSDTTELAEDLLAITTVFVARNNGKRSAKYRKQRKEDKLQKEEKEKTEKIEETKN